MVALTAGRQFFINLGRNFQELGERLNQCYPGLGQSLVDGADQIKQTTLEDSQQITQLQESTRKIHQAIEVANQTHLLSTYQNLSAAELLKENPSHYKTEYFLTLKHPNYKKEKFEGLDLIRNIIMIIADKHYDWQDELKLITRVSRAEHDGEFISTEKAKKNLISYFKKQGVDEEYITTVMNQITDSIEDDFASDSSLDLDYYKEFIYPDNFARYVEKLQAEDASLKKLSEIDIACKLLKLIDITVINELQKLDLDKGYHEVFAKKFAQSQ